MANPNTRPKVDKWFKARIAREFPVADILVKLLKTAGEREFFMKAIERKEARRANS